MKGVNLLMLDQNTDRMWYVIGAIVIGAAIIAMGLNIYSESFETVDDMMVGAMDIADNYMYRLNGVEPEIINELHTYNKVEGGYEVSGFNRDYIDEHYGGRNPRRVNIPAEYKGEPVIGVVGSEYTYSTFRGLHHLVLPDTLEYIGDRAFRYGSLTKVDLPEGLKRIGTAAFAQNKLVELDIPDSVIEIGNASFNDNQLIGDRAFIYSRDDDGTVDYTKVISYGGRNKNVQLPDNIEIIDKYAFQNNHLEAIDFTNNLRRIESTAFRNNRLKSIVIPDSVTYLCNNVFLQNELEDIHLGSNIDRIGISTFADNNLKSITIPANIKYISVSSFSLNYISEVYIPETVEIMNTTAFNRNGLNQDSNNLEFDSQHGLWRLDGVDWNYVGEGL